jgi:copper chaperone CopZ
MYTFWHRRTAFFVLLIAILSVSLPGWATPPTKERLPLTLSGPGCSSKEAEMNTVLQAIPGVTGVYFNRVPNHVLVDITTGTVNAADVIKHVNAAAASWQCKVEFIEGCISASMPSASATPHHSE